MKGISLFVALTCPKILRGRSGRSEHSFAGPLDSEITSALADPLLSLNALPPMTTST